MAEQMGARIREARLAAGMTQKELAEAVDGVSASGISRAERGLKELTDEQLAAIAEATGSETLLAEAKEEAPKAVAEEPEEPAAGGNGILDLVGSVAPAVVAAAPAVLDVAQSVLGGDEQEEEAPAAQTTGGADAMSAMMGMMGGMMGGGDAGGADAMSAMMGMMGGDAGGADAMSAMMGMMGGMMGAEAGEDSKE